MEPFQSSQAFVRALKSAADPPTAGGLLKIELARKAWDNALFYVPRKEEVIADWILTRLIKDKGKERSINPIVDGRYWSLLSDVISTKESSSTASSTLSVKSWLVPLLNRVPFAPIIVAFFNLLPKTRIDTRRDLTLHVRKSLTVIWPLAVHKSSAETLLECIGALLEVLDEATPGEDLAQICLWIVSSYRTSLENSAAKKKLYASFTQLYLPRWVECTLVAHAPDSMKTLLEQIYTAGVETIFNTDTLRQLSSPESVNPLFEPLEQYNKSKSAMLLLIMPRLFSSFLYIIKKHRSVLFPQVQSQPSGASWGNLRAAGVRFYASCQDLLKHSNLVAESWTTRASLLVLVEEENLFTQTPGVAEVLRKDVKLALRALNTDTDEVEVEDASVAVAVDCLSTLTRIDYDLVLPSVPKILPRILLISGRHRSLFRFLDLLLEYHTKTRTMSAYIGTIFSAFAPDQVELPIHRSYDYEVSSKCALLHPIHLDHIAKAIQLFLVPTHVLETMRHVFEILKDSWQLVRHPQRQPLGEEEGPRKKRKISDTDQNQEQLESSNQAVSLALKTTMASVVLSSLPLNSLPQDARGEVLTSMEDFRESFIYHTLSKTLKTIRKASLGDDIFTEGIVATGSLRLLYSTNLPQHPLTSEPYYNAQLPEKLLGAINEVEQLPSMLKLEIYRTLLDYASTGHLADPQMVLEHILTYLDNNRASSSDKSTLLRLLVDRWLPVIDSLGSAEQLERLLQHFVTHPFKIGDHNPQENVVHALSAKTLVSAQFWELPNLRTALLAYTDKATAETSTASSDLQQQTNILAVFHTLLSFPTDYLTRAMKLSTMKRALSLDILVNVVSEDNSQTAFKLCILRVYASRMLVNLGPTDLPTHDIFQSLQYLITSQFSSEDKTWIHTTLDLIEVLTSALLKSSEKIPEYLDQYKLLAPSHFRRADIRSKSFVRLVEILLKDHTLSSISEDMQDQLRELHDNLFSTFISTMSSMNDLAWEVIATKDDIYRGWSSVLSLGRWLGLQDRAIPTFGRDFCSKLVALPILARQDETQGFVDIGVTVFNIVIEELQASPEISRVANLDIAIASYIALSKIVGSQGRTNINISMAKACSVMSTTEYTYITETTAILLSEMKRPSSDLMYMIQLSSVILQDPPHSSSQITQAFTTRCLEVFVSSGIYTVGPQNIRNQMLQFLVHRCTDRPASLRQSDLSSIWSLISKLMSGSESHEDETSVSVFHDIVAVVSVLVRLRRDLIALTLPHLGVALRQLVMLTRQPRPHLGGKQSSIISNTLPVWINIEHPLGPAEGKALARLLEALTIKSIPRTYASSNNNTEVRKAESLSKPFSKHAAYVLKAYIDAMNDPICILPLDLRKELRPGLFALCDMLNEHSRDALMLSSLDSGGKTTMKSLWKEYEKQHYVGKG